jgi:hypothetical protein
VHLIEPFEIPYHWPRYWVVDFGYTNPFVCQWWAEDPDGRLYRYRELYRTQTLVEDHAQAILKASGVIDTGHGKKGWVQEPRPRVILCDHDAEDRATLEKHLEMPTVPAKKEVMPGIQEVASRFKVQPDGKSRLFLFKNALIERDELLTESKKPTCTEEEIEGYVWDETVGRKKGEEPVKKDDHGCDAMRYMIRHLDAAAHWQGQIVTGRLNTKSSRRSAFGR